MNSPIASAVTHRSTVVQVEVADYVVLNKVDMLGAARLPELQAMIGVVNPLCEVVACSHGQARCPHARVCWSECASALEGCPYSRNRDCACSNASQTCISYVPPKSVRFSACCSCAACHAHASMHLLATATSQRQPDMATGGHGRAVRPQRKGAHGAAKHGGAAPRLHGRREEASSRRGGGGATSNGARS